jgi:hypothetical protein
VHPITESVAWLTSCMSCVQVYFTPVGSSGAAAEFALDNLCVQQYLLNLG